MNMSKAGNHRNSHSRRQMREQLFKLQGGRCFWCEREMTLAVNPIGYRPRSNYATIDELKPRARGGTRARINIVLACGPCNLSRGATVAPSWAFERVAERERAQGF